MAPVMTRPRGVVFRFRQTCLTLTILAGWVSAAAADPTPGSHPGTNAPTGEPVSGVALHLKMQSPGELDEGIPITRQVLAATIYVKNVSQRRKVFVRTRMPLYVPLEFVDQKGARYSPTFLPPPMPRPGGPRKRRVTLAPGQLKQLGSVHTFSGFLRKGRSYPMLPAGRYEVHARDVEVPRIKGKRSSNAAPLVVHAADRARGSLKLDLSARRAWVQKDQRTQLDISFSNTGKRPLSLDLQRGQLELQVKGPSTSSKEARHRKPSAHSPHSIQPGGRLKIALPFPGTVGQREYDLTSPGWYWMVLRYTVAKSPAKSSEGKDTVWRGEVRSRPLWIELRGN